MNRRGFLSALSKAVVAGPIAVTQIGKPTAAAVVEDGVVSLKPGTYRSLLVKGCTFNPLPGESAVELSDLQMNIKGPSCSVMLKDSITTTVDEVPYKPVYYFKSSEQTSEIKKSVPGGRHAIDEEPL